MRPIWFKIKENILRIKISQRKRLIEMKVFQNENIILKKKKKREKKKTDYGEEKESIKRLKSKK